MRRDPGLSTERGPKTVSQSEVYSCLGALQAQEALRATARLRRIYSRTFARLYDLTRHDRVADQGAMSDIDASHPFIVMPRVDGSLAGC